MPDRTSPPVAVVVGSGSAGRRHAAALRRADPAMALVVVRRPGSRTAGGAPLAPDVVVVESLDQAMEHRPAIGVVASPAPFHRIAAVALAGAGCSVLVEKPLAATVADAEALVSEAGSANGGRLAVGYHLRHSDTVTTIRDLLGQGAIGTPTTFELAVGQHLSGWRPAADPRRSVTARQELGGGVLLELSHELDAVRHLLGEVADVAATLGYGGAPTDGVVETVADLELTLRSGARGTVHLDMVSPEGFRRWRIVGSAGTIEADLLRSRVTVERDRGPTEVVEHPPGERDRAEDRLIAELLALARPGAGARCTAADGVAALRIVEAARAAAARTTVVTV